MFGVKMYAEKVIRFGAAGATIGPLSSHRLSHTVDYLAYPRDHTPSPHHRHRISDIGHRNTVARMEPASHADCPRTSDIGSRPSALGPQHSSTPLCYTSSAEIFPSVVNQYDFLSV